MLENPYCGTRSPGTIYNGVMVPRITDYEPHKNTKLKED